MTSMITLTCGQAEDARAAKTVLACALGMAVLNASALFIEFSVDGVIPSAQAFLALYVVALAIVALLAKPSREVSVLTIAAIHLFVAGLDLGLTWKFIVHGAVQEANPIASFTIEYLGTGGLLALKLLGTGLPTALMFALPKDRRVAWVALFALAGSAWIVLVWSAAIPAS